MDYNESILKKLYNTVLDLLFPEKHICFFCGKHDKSIDEEHICLECMSKLMFIENRCIICGKPLEAESTTNRCADCIRHPHYFTSAISAVEYAGFIKKAIYNYKYGNKAYMYKAFGYLMVQAMQNNNINEFDIIVPVPLHRDKWAKRGFNQSELLAKYISKKYRIPIDTKSLRRTRKTIDQNKLHKLQRLQNTKNAFEVRNRDIFREKIVLLVDDILTTGATADECSKVLIESGARMVIVISIATGRNILI